MLFRIILAKNEKIHYNFCHFFQEKKQRTWRLVFGKNLRTSKNAEIPKT